MKKSTSGKPIWSETKTFIFASLWFQPLQISKKPDYQWKITFLTNVFSVDIYLSYLPHSDVYFVTCLPQSNRKLFQVQKTFSNHCTSRLLQQSSSSSEWNPNWWWENIFQHNQLPSIPGSIFQSFFSSVIRSRSLRFYYKHPANPSFQPKSFAGHITWTEQYWCWKFQEWSPWSHQTEFDISYETEILPNHDFFPLLDTSAILTTPHTKLQFTFPHWNSMLITTSLQKRTRCKSVMNLPIVFLLTPQLFHVRISLNWCLSSL